MASGGPTSPDARQSPERGWPTRGLAGAPTPGPPRPPAPPGKPLPSLRRATSAPAPPPSPQPTRKRRRWDPPARTPDHVARGGARGRGGVEWSLRSPGGAASRVLAAGFQVSNVCRMNESAFTFTVIIAFTFTVIISIKTIIQCLSPRA
ncbi:formin-like protein 18 [Balaenoptera musculus]|uniref:Formin-like protein 18 n=1 Tax=Balaenoptera musculus TaxID=9771 RepID=A0A8B8Z4P3_BALMU|nr:formin-like protein 18 [Balaenoptera musculus]